MNILIISIFILIFIGGFAFAYFNYKPKPYSPPAVILQTEKLPDPEPKPEQENRLQPKDIELGDTVRIEWSMVAGGVGNLKCISNDPDTKKILLQMKWLDYKKHNLPEYHDVIFNYNDKELVNLHLLNPHLVEKKKKKAEKKEMEKVAKAKEAADKKEAADSTLKSVYCNYRGILIVHDINGKKVHELSGEMTRAKCKEIDERTREGITEFDGLDDYKRIASLQGFIKG